MFGFIRYHMEFIQFTSARFLSTIQAIKVLESTQYIQKRKGNLC